MVFHPLLSSLVALMSIAASTSAASGSPGLTLAHLFKAEIQVSADKDLISYPYGGGKRLNVAFIGGSLSTPANETIATLVPGLGGEQGTIREDGVALVDARVVFQFDKSFDSDQKFAFLHLRGKSIVTGNVTKGLNYMQVHPVSSHARILTINSSEFETDSPAFSYLNNYFLAGQLSRDGLMLLADFYGVRSFAHSRPAALANTLLNRQIRRRFEPDSSLSLHVNCLLWSMRYE